MAEKLSKTIFFTLILFLPINLGYHFILKSAYIDGLLIDYLIPVIYIQDILVVIFIALNFKHLLERLRNLNKYLIWFLFTVFITSITSTFLISSMAAFLRLFLYAFFMAVVRVRYANRISFKYVVSLLGWAVILLSALSFVQWFKQGSVFDNYLILGEQPYSISTPNINIESFFGKARVPPYATFRHPNIFAGILSILLVWFLFFMSQLRHLKLAYILGLITLGLTLSKFSWISFILGAGFYLLYKKTPAKAKNFLIGIVFSAIILSLFLPFFTNFSELNNRPSFYRRADLLESSYKLINLNTLFGVGYNNSTVYIDQYLPPSHDVRFPQPPHNMFVLVFLEAGALALFFFSAFIFSKIKKSYTNPVLLVALMQVLFLGVFDHYFFTIHQPQLLFWLILGFI